MFLSNATRVLEKWPTLPPSFLGARQWGLMKPFLRPWIEPATAGTRSGCSTAGLSRRLWLSIHQSRNSTTNVCVKISSFTGYRDVSDVYIYFLGPNCNLYKVWGGHISFSESHFAITKRQYVKEMFNCSDCR